MALLLLAGGAVVNVAVAWGIVICVNPDATAVRSESYDDSERREIRRFVPSDELIDLGFGFEQVFRSTSLRHDVRRIPFVVRDKRFDPPRVTEKASGTISETGAFFVSDIYIVSAGFPVRCFRGSAHQLMDDGWTSIPRVSAFWLPESGGLPRTTSGAIAMKMPAIVGGETRLFPYKIVPFATFLNTLFYALLLWLLFAAPFAARRMLRRRRGLCEKCAYPIGTWGGSPVCTECGAAVTRKAQA